jgi:hypothetical protein
VFRYRGAEDYEVLFALSALIVAALAGTEPIRRRISPPWLETEWSPHARFRSRRRMQV